MKNTATKRVLAALLLLAAGALAVAQSSQAAKNKALFNAAKSGTAADIRAAIKAGADVNAREGILAMTPLMYAAERNEDPDAVKALLDAGASVNAVNNYDQTALMYAASSNENADVTKALIDAGAWVDSEAFPPIGMSALMLAASSNTNPEVIKTLLAAGASTDESHGSFRNGTALTHAVAKNPNPLVIKALLDGGAKDNLDDALMKAVMHNTNVDVIKTLIAAGADVNAKGNESILIWAVRNNVSFDVIKALIDAGADVNACAFDVEGLGSTRRYTVLMYAARYSTNTEVLKVLLESGADVNQSDQHGQTPLMKAIRYNTNPDVVRFLIGAGVNVKLQDDTYKRAIDYLKMRNESDAEFAKTDLEKVLIDAGGNEYNVIVLTEASPSPAGKKVELTIWEESRSESGEFIKQAAVKYHETHPNVTIKFVNMRLGDAAGQIALDGPAGMGADLFAAPHDHLDKLVNGGHILPTVDPSGVKAKVLGACSKALTYNGTMYGYPISAETYALFYNRRLISDDEVPTTWEGLKDWVIDFNASHPGKRGFVMDVGTAYYSIIFTTANGNRLFGKNGDDTSSTYLNTPDAVAGMKFFQSLRSALDVHAVDLMTGNCDGAFLRGTAAMCINGPWNLKPFKEAGLDFGVAPLPALPGDSTPAASFSGTRAMFVSAYTHYPEEAADFARFLISEDMQRLRFDITGATPSIRVEVSSPYIGGFLEQLEYAFPWPSIPQMVTFWMTFGSASANIWNVSDV